MQNQPQNNFKETAVAFTEITIKEFLGAISKYKIGQYGSKSGKQGTEKLAQSFRFQIDSSNQHNLRILISFLYYGSFVEWGVGKGVTIEDVPTLSKARGLTGRIDGQKRRPKKWYSKTIYHEVKQLRNILAKKYGIEAQFAIDLHTAGEISINLF